MKRPQKKVGKIKSAIVNWLGLPIELTDGDFWAQYYGNSNAAGQKISEKTVMSLSAAWACTRLISESVGTLPLKLYKKTSNGREEAKDHPLYDILRYSPNSSSTPSTYWEANTAAILLRGNGISEQQFIGSRRVGLKFLPPNRLNAKKDSNGNVKLFYIEDDGKQRPLDNKKLFHIPGFSLDGKWGLSTISYGASVFGSALAAGNAANSTFEKGLAPTNAITIDRILKKEQRDEYRTTFEDISGAINAGKTAVLEKDMDVKTIGIKPSDAQLLESRSYSVEEVCRWFRVDPSLVGHGNKDSNWGTGLEQKLIAFLTFTLRPHLNRIEQVINKQLLRPEERRKYYAEFSIEGLLRADSKGRAAFYSVMVNNGIFTRDEVRQLENMPLKGGNADVLTVQTAMAPLDLIGQSTDSDQARAALSAWLNQGESKTEEES